MNREQIIILDNNGLGIYDLKGAEIKIESLGNEKLEYDMEVKQRLAIGSKRTVKKIEKIIKRRIEYEKKSRGY